MKKTFFLSSALFALPLVAFAQQVDTGPVKSIIQAAGGLFNSLIPVLIAAALVVFFWGLVKYLRGGGKDTTQGRQIMVSGLIALFVMVSVWGIVRLMQEALGVDQNAQGTIPQIPVNGSGVQNNPYSAPPSSPTFI